MNLQQATHLLGAYLDVDVPTFIWGKPGVGKSDTVRQIAAARNLPVIDFRAILRDPVDLRGLPAVIDGAARWLPPSDLPHADRDGDEGILFLDELNAAAPSVQAACFGLVLDRKVGEYTLPKGWRIIAAGNRQSDKAAAQRMPTALANRFAHIDVEPDLDAFMEWAIAADIDPMVIGFLRWRPGLLHNMDQVNEPRAFATPRAWANVSKIMSVIDQSNGALTLAALTGIIGEAAGSEFFGFLRIYRELPPLDSVLANPEGAKIPGDVSARFAIATALARRVDASTIGAGLTYCQRLAGEFQTIFVMDAIRRDKELQKTKPFIDWAVKNQDVVLSNGKW